MILEVKLEVRDFFFFFLVDRKKELEIGGSFIDEIVVLRN